MSIQPFHDQAIATSIAYLRALTLRGSKAAYEARCRADMYLLRDSLRYRADSILWHGQLLSRMQSGALAKLQATFPDPNAPDPVMRQTAHEQQFAFDDVLFNSVALFDYIGNTVGFALYGEQRKKAKWDNIQRYSRDGTADAKDHANPRLHGSELGQLIAETDTTLVSPLGDYRAALIHYSTVPAGAGVSTRFTSAPDGRADVSFDLSVTVPTPFAKLFVVPGHESDPKTAPLTVAADWLIVRVLSMSRAILRELERTLRAEAGGDPDATERILAG